MQKIVFYDRISEHPTRRKLITTDTQQVFGSYDVERDEGTVSQAGTPLNAQTFNTMQSNIESAIGIAVTGTLTAGSTSITLSSELIDSNSSFDFYTSIFGVNPTAISVTTGAITLTFPVQATDMGVKVVILE